jgi:ribosomal protein S18 acetylase RimI-like enzyme
MVARVAGIRVRTGVAADMARVTPLYDQAVRWLADRGRGGQWGTEPWSRQPEMIASLERVIRAGGLRVAETEDGDLIGTLWVTQAPRYVTQAAEPELYLGHLVVDRRHAGRGVGRALLDAAEEEAAERGARQLRLDCWAAGDQALVHYYERAGFTRTEQISLPAAQGRWKGTVLTRRI